MGADVPGLPTRIQVEVTGACNLRCRMCLVAYRPPKPPTRAGMSLERLRAILDDLPDLEELTLQGLGEPLLAPDLFPMIAEAKRRGIRVGFNTNATLLTADRSEQLIALELDWLHVSIDGATPETFGAIRAGGRLDVVTANLRRLVELRRAAGRTRPRVQVNTVLMRRNTDERAAIVELAADVGVDRMWVQRLSHDFSDVGDDDGYRAIASFASRQQLDERAASGALAAAAAAARRRGLDIRLPGADDRPATDRPCDWPWTSSYVTHEGLVQPCCMVMGSDRATLGSLEDQSFAAVWRDRPYEDFRRRVDSPTPPEVCAGCSLYRGRF